MNKNILNNFFGLRKQTKANNKKNSVKLCVSSVYLCVTALVFSLWSLVLSLWQTVIANKVKQSVSSNFSLRSSVFGLLTLFTLLTQAQVTVQADTTKIRIGEQIQLKYIVDKQDGVQFPNKLALDSLQKMEVVKSFNVDTINNKLIKKYALTSFDSGQYELPAQLINIQGKKYQTKPITIDVSTVAVDTTKQKLFPIKAIQHQKLDLKDYARNYWWLLLLLPIIGFAIWWFFIRKKPTEEERIAKIPPFEMAVQQLEQLDKKLLWQNNKTKEYYSELTDILRNYIEKEFKVPAMESTTGELISALKKFKNESGIDIPKKTILKLKDLLKEADLVKFAKSKPYAEEIQMHRKYADTILEGLKVEEKVIEEAIENKEQKEETKTDDVVENNSDNQKNVAEDDQ